MKQYLHLYLYVLRLLLRGVVVGLSRKPVLSLGLGRVAAMLILLGWWGVRSEMVIRGSVGSNITSSGDGLAMLCLRVMHSHASILPRVEISQIRNRRPSSTYIPILNQASWKLCSRFAATRLNSCRPSRWARKMGRWVGKLRSWGL
jgi:hypothetical protein